jgi:hypothetical protein
VEFPVGFLAWGLVSGACVTGINIFLGELAHAGPIIVSGYELEGLFVAQVSCSVRVMARAKDLELEVVVLRDVYESVAED